MSIDLQHCIRFLRSCYSHHSINSGRQIHQLLLKSGHTTGSLFISNCLLQMYSRCNVRDAHLFFDEMPQRNCFSYNSLIDTYLKSQDTHNALLIFNSMHEKNTFSWNAVVTGLIRSGDVESARKLFDDMPIKEAVACNALIHGYFREGLVDEAFCLFKKMGSECMGSSAPCGDSFVLATVLSACADQRILSFGKQIHSRIVVGQVKMDSVLGSTMVNMYAKCEDLDNACRVLDQLPEVDEFSLSALISGYAGCGRLVEARRVFDRRENPSIVFWNSLINGYVSNCQIEEALELFIRMRREGGKPDSSTFASILSACASVSMLEYSKQIHACAFKNGNLGGIIVASALIDLYSKSGLWEDACKVFAELKVYDTIMLNSMINLYCNCGRIEEARWVFDTIPSKTLISWNSMIVGYSQNGYAIEALNLFGEMHRLGLPIDQVALASSISASASICYIRFGEQLFALSTILGLHSDHIITSALVDLFCKCGNVVYGRMLFNEMKRPDEVLYNSMLMGFASNGYGSEVLELFEAMRSEGIRPNEVTFIAILSGCCHCGLIEEGLSWFNKMKGDYGIEPLVEHYSCIVDLFVRAGRLEEAVDFIENMPYQADVSMWTSVLGGCKAHGDEALARKVVERLVEIDYENASHYVQLASVFASSGEWDRSAQVRGMMCDRNIAKNPGHSWIDH